MKNKYLARLFLVLTFLFISTAAYLLLPDQKKIERPKPTIQNLTWEDVATNTAISNNKQNISPKPTITNETEPDKTQINTSTTKPEVIKPISENSLNTTIEINGTLYQLQLPEKSSAYEAMQNLINSQKITASIKEYSGMGKFVEEINGIKNDNQTGKYWIYYINDKSAKVGISAYTLKQNDKITWKYERSKF